MVGWEVAQWLRTPTAHAENWGSVPNTYTWWLTTTLIPAPGDPTPY